MKIKFLLFFLILLVQIGYSAHLYNEKYYQNQWCSKYSGIMEYKLKDSTRVDCLTKNYAVEFDFAPKWAESIGQSLYYAKMTGKKPAIVLIIETPYDFKYYKRAEILAKEYNIQLWYMKQPEYVYKKPKEESYSDVVYTIAKQIYYDLIRSYNAIIQ